MFEKSRETVGGLVGQGREQAQALRAKRQRSRWINQLGEFCYREQTGETVDAEEMKRLVMQITDLANPTADDEVDLRPQAGSAPEADSETKPVPEPDDVKTRTDHGS